MPKQSNGTKEVLTRVRLICTELDSMLKKLPPVARVTIGDLALDMSKRFNIHQPDVKAIISFYFHTKYEIGDEDFMLRRGRTGGIQTIPKGVNNHGP